MKKLFRPLVFILASAICLFVAELALRIFAPVPDPYADFKYKREVNQYIKSEFPKNLHLITAPEEGLPGVQGPTNRFTINNMGFRGDELTVPKPVNEFRIFMVGGSTTECMYLDDSKAITRVVQQELSKHAPAGIAVKVYGAGKAGDASDDHISMIAHRIAQLEPDMIIVFSGINDLTRGINNYDYSHYPKAAPEQKIPLLKSVATEFQIPRRIYYLFDRISSNPTQVFQKIHLRSQFKESVRLCAALPVSDQRPRVDANAYANNLKTIAGVARAHGIRLIMMTQQTTWNNTANPELKAWHWVVCRSGVRYREDFMDEAMETLNDRMRQVAKENSIALYDLAKSMPKSREYFYDDVHFNEQGAYTAGVKLAALILETHPLNPNSN